MKFKSLLWAALSLFGYAASGQVTTPSVEPIYNYDNRLCAHKQTSIPVQLYGKFNDDNRFYIELLSEPGNKPLANYEAVLRNGSLVFTIGSEVQETYNRINYRIATTSPVTRTRMYSTYWYSRGQISISRPAGDSDTLNAGMSYLVNVNTDANNPVTMTFSDSSVWTFGSTGYQQTIGLVALKSTEIFVVNAVNACNVPVPSSGKIPLAINPVSIIPVKVNNRTALCEGNEIELNYAVSGGTIPESATFRLRFFKPYGAGAGEKRIFEVPATKKANGVLLARVPENLVVSSTTTHIAIVVDKPALVSPYLESTIYQKPAASFSSQSGTVSIGEEFGLGFEIAGPPPYTIELSNGASYALDDNRYIYVNPVKTETYSIRSLRTACGVTTDFPKQNIVATVPAGIAINLPSYQQKALCENQKVRLPIVTNAAFNANTKFTVEGITWEKTTYEFEAKMVNDSIEFLIPHSPATWIKEGYFSIKSFRVKTSNPSLTSAYKGEFNIRGIPRVNYDTRSPRTLTGPQYYEYTLNVSGGLPFALITDEGVRDPVAYPDPPRIIFVPATGAYGLKSIENACYTNSDPARLHLTVNPYTSQAPEIVVHPPTRKYLCDPDSVEVSFEALGKFGEGNKFQVFRSGTNYSAPLLVVSKPGKYKIAASAMGGVPSYEWLSVKSTNPEVQARSPLPFNLQTKPTLLDPGQEAGTPENPRMVGFHESPSLPALFKSFIPYVAEFTDGVKTYRFERISEADSYTHVIPGAKVIPYTLKSLSNACGTLEANITTYLYKVGYKLSMRNFLKDQRFCAGQEMIVPFYIEKGNAPAGTTYHLQVGKGARNFKTVASKTTPEDFRYAVPDTMVGEYFVRIVTDLGVGVEEKRFFVNKIPTATVAPGDQTPSEIEYGQVVDINYNLTGGGPWELVLNGRGNVSTTYSPVMRGYALSRGAVFELQSVSNPCGYGTVSGSVAVRVKPRIVSFQLERSDLCNGENINVSYHVAGDIPSGEKVGFYLNGSNGRRVELPSATGTMGTASLAVPGTLSGGSFELICYITGSEISESRQVNIKKVPDIELTGNTTINQGQRASLMIRSTSAGNLPVSVTLSDGTRTEFSSWGMGAFQYAGVTPATTTTYTIASAVSSCGNARTSGSVTVTVNPPSARTVIVRGISKLSPFCEKDTMLVYFESAGTFSAGNQFSVQFYDDQGKLVNSLPAAGKESPLRVIIPAGFPVSAHYHIRVAASDANTASADYQQVGTFGTKPAAAFASNYAILDQQGNARAVVLLSGTGPWQYSYGNDLGALKRNVSISPDTLLITSKEPSAYFKLLSVSNGCGVGTVSEPSTIRVEVVLGTEEPGTEVIAFGPNPTNGRITLRFQSGSQRQLALYGVNGMLIWTKNIHGAEAEVDMQEYPSGSYLLKIEGSKERQVLKIVKE